MRRAHRGVEVVLVAGDAGRGRRGVVVVGVTLYARHIGVAAGQGIFSIERVIKLGRGHRPVGGRMARGAVAGQAKLRMVRIVRAHVIGRVAGVALGRSSLECVVGVAGSTGKSCVRAGQCITGVFQVVKLGVEPAVHRMTALAGSREAKPDVVDHRGQIVLLMAGVAGRRQSDELAGGGVLVAVFALRQLVRAHQRETVLVVFDGLQRDLPPLHGVATGAVGAELAAMDIGVAIRALGADVLENQVRMALNAIHFFVHAAQGIPGQIVIELGIRPYGLPACVCMAVGTRRRKRAMRIGDFGFGCIYAGSDRGT